MFTLKLLGFYLLFIILIIFQKIYYNIKYKPFKLNIKDLIGLLIKNLYFKKEKKKLIFKFINLKKVITISNYKSIYIYNNNNYKSVFSLFLFSNKKPGIII